MLKIFVHEALAYPLNLAKNNRFHPRHVVRSSLGWPIDFFSPHYYFDFTIFLLHIFNIIEQQINNVNLLIKLIVLACLDQITSLSAKQLST